MKNFLLFLVTFSSMSLLSQTVIQSEDFETGLPSTWTMDTGWEAGTADALASQYFAPPGTSGILCLNDDAANPGGSGSVETSEIDLSAYTAVLMSFDSYFINGDYEGDEQASVSLSGDAGSTWTEVLNLDGAGEWENLVINLSDYAGGSVWISFNYVDAGGWEYGFAIDNFEVYVPADQDAILSLASNSLQTISTVGEEITFDFNVMSYGAEDFSGFSFVYTIDGGAEQTMAATTDLSIGDSETFSLTLGEGTHAVSASIVDANGVVVGQAMDVSLTVAAPIPNFTLTDSYGNEHELYEYLNEGTSVLIHFMTSWNGIDESITPEVNSVWEDFGEGETGFQVMGLSVEPTDNNSVVNNLGWGGYYPKFAYDIINDEMFYHYAGMVGAGGGIPFFVMICPNPDNPGFSNVSYSAEGWAAGGTSQLELENAVLDCNPSLSLENEIEKPLVSLYPNPTSNYSVLEINSNKIVDVEVINSIGQVVFEFYSEANLELKSVEIPVETLSAGMYSVNVKVGDQFVTENLSVIK